MKLEKFEKKDDNLFHVIFSVDKKPENIDKIKYLYVEKNNSEKIFFNIKKIYLSKDEKKLGLDLILLSGNIGSDINNASYKVLTEQELSDISNKIDNKSKQQQQQQQHEEQNRVVSVPIQNKNKNKKGLTKKHKILIVLGIIILLVIVFRKPLMKLISSLFSKNKKGATKTEPNTVDVDAEVISTEPINNANNANNDNTNNTQQPQKTGLLSEDDF